jgi:uncharacterized protein YdeI (YjbR/CyaY-like superfamily)
MGFMKIISFKSSRDFRAWLEKNFERSSGIGLRIYKKYAGVATVTYDDAVDQAICFGWIDGQRKPYDKQSWIQMFSPRRAKSGWSKINTQRAERLIKTRKMALPGLTVVEAAKKDGRWKAGYDSFSHAKVPDDFLKALRKNKKAKAFFETLNKTNLYSIAFRLQTAKKPETRKKRLLAIIEMLSQEKKLHG